MASTIPIEPVNGVTKAEDKSLNLDSLKAHVSRESLWMLLHDKVYDVTKFMDEVGDDAPWLCSNAFGGNMEGS